MSKQYTHILTDIEIEQVDLNEGFTIVIRDGERFEVETKRDDVADWAEKHDRLQFTAWMGPHGSEYEVSYRVSFDRYYEVVGSEVVLEYILEEEINLKPIEE